MALNLGAVVMKLDGDSNGLISSASKANLALAGVKKASIGVARQGLDVMNNGFEATANVIKTGLIVGIGAGIGAFSLIGSQAVKQAGDFEIYRSTLTTMLGTQELANKRLKEYAEIGAKTPFELNQVVALGNQLQAMGKYSRDNVIMLGDLAAAAGKPIDQVGAAYAKLVTGQKGMAVDMFRDLLITTDDWVKVTGKGVSSTGELMATTEDMLKALPQIMADKKFSGMMDMQSQTFQGKWSNMIDALNSKLRDFGEKLLPLIKPYLDQFITFVSNIDLSGMIDNFGNLYNLLFKGDYTGLFGLEEDDPIVDILFRIREGFLGIYSFITSNTPEANSILVGLATVIGTLVVGAFISMGLAVIGATWPFIGIGIVAAGLFYLFQTNLPLFWALVAVIGVIAMIILASFVPAMWAAATATIIATAPILAIIVVIGLLVFAGVWLWQNWGWIWPMIVDLARQAWENIKRIFGPAWQWFDSNIITPLKAIFNILVAEWQKNFTSLKDNFQSFWDKAVQIKDGIVSAFQGIQTGVGNALKGVVNSLIGNLNNAVGGVNSVIRNLPDIPGVGKIPEIPTIPGFKKGVTNFEGGLAYVHQDEMLANLPKGTDVLTANQTKNLLNQKPEAKQASNQTTQHITININGSNLSLEAIAQKVSATLSRQNRNTGLGMNNAYA